jgi:cytochrome oxidase assembly protein ShyY1
MTDAKSRKEDTRKLAFVVILMSMFVLVLYGLGPLI